MYINKYKVTGPRDCKIVFLADFHEKEPQKVIAALKEIKPDLILMGGDILERNDVGRDPKFDQFLNQYNKIKRQRKQLKRCFYFLLRHFLCNNPMNHENAYELFSEASKLAPVIMSRGNHEWYYAPEDYWNISKYGVTLVDNAFVEWEGLLIGGLSPCFDCDFLKNYDSQEGFKILLCHHPEYYQFLLARSSFDLILSGHAHGGQIRFGDRGLFSPGQGAFPKLICGKYFDRLIVTSGCANTTKIPRWGNPCEVVEITMVQT